MANDSHGQVVGAGIGPDSKWVVRSRALAAVWLPVLGMALHAAGYSEAVPLLGVGVDSALSLAGAGMALWHVVRPDGATRTLLPTLPGSALSGLLVLALGAPGALWLAGCASDAATGASRVDREACAEVVEQARALELACGLVEGDDPAANQARCKLGVAVARAAAELGCSFADDVDGSGPGE